MAHIVRTVMAASILASVVQAGELPGVRDPAGVEQARTRLKAEQRRQGEAMRRETGAAPPAPARRAQDRRMRRQMDALVIEPPRGDPVPAARHTLESQRLQFRILEGTGIGRPLR